MVTNEKLWKNCRERLDLLSAPKGDEKSTEGDEKKCVLFQPINRRIVIDPEKII